MALQACEGHEGAIHLLVTDVVMPGEGGRVLVKMLGASYKWDMEVETLELLLRAIGEYLHMRRMKDA